MKKILAITFLVSLFFLEVRAQQPVLQEDVLKDSIVESSGPNRKNFSHFFLSWGFITGPSEGAGSDIKYGVSRDLILGYRFKRKISNTFAVGIDFHYSNPTFHLEQKAGKTLPLPTLHESEKINFNNLGSTIFTRVNFGKRGNFLGTYVDLGFYGNYISGASHVYREVNGSPLGSVSNASRATVTLRGLRYVENYNYGLTGRFAKNRFGVFYMYRLSDLFDPAFGYSELPRHTVGLQVNLM